MTRPATKGLRTSPSISRFAARDTSALAAVVERVEKVVPSDIQGVARREFTPDRTQVVVFASRKRLEAALRRLGPIWWHEF